MNRPHRVLCAAKRKLHDKVVTRIVSIAIPLESVNNLLPIQLVGSSKGRDEVAEHGVQARDRLVD